MNDDDLTNHLTRELHDRADTIHGATLGLADVTGRARSIRRRRAAQIHPAEPAQHRRFVQRLLDAGIGEIEPLLQEVNPQHERKTHRLTAIARLRIVRLDQSL